MSNHDMKFLTELFPDATAHDINMLFIILKHGADRGVVNPAPYMELLAEFSKKASDADFAKIKKECKPGYVLYYILKMRSLRTNNE